ncbi:MAG TPA: ATP-binding protein [Thermoanaerobaculia bacterium]|nr:ATP-binding protein [Thermoanaerobaculia bacterium]
MELVRSVVSPPPAAQGSNHLVQFYDRDFAAAGVARFLGDGLAHGRAAVVIATPEHRQAIAAALAEHARGAAAAEAAGRLVYLDADERLHAVCDARGEPTVDGVRRELGPLIADLAARWGRVHAYGEMVDLLAGAGRIDAAVVLEEAWNELLPQYPVELLCACRLSAFDGDADSHGFRRVCAAHAHVDVADDGHTAGLAHGRLAAELLQKDRLARHANERLADLQGSQAELADAAERAGAAKDEFFAMLGHELRNPLSPILTALQLMKLRGSGELERERTIIERQVHHLLRLVDDLLDVSRITSGKLRLERKPVELAEVVAQAIERVGPLIAQRAHRLHVDVPTDGLLVEGDPARLAQVVANLLMNAGKYTPSEGRIEVRATVEGSEAMLAVRDNGLGIPAELLPSVFDLFVQGPRGRDRSEGGLGLGLAIVQNLVRLHGGSVAVHSDGIGKGAEFTVRLPLALRVRDGESLAAKGQPAWRGRRVRVLVVDDNVDAAQTLAELIETMGCEARVAHDGPAALLAAQELQPELVLLDIGLPVMDGYEVAARLRRACRGPLRIAALTGYGQPEDHERSRRAGFDCHFVKPLAPEALQALIAGLVASQAAGATGIDALLA